MAKSKIYIEQGKSSAFAVSLDWPGWCRRAKTPELAVAALDDYAPRYRKIVGEAFAPGDFQILGTLPGNGTTDYGAPDARGPWDETALSAKELARQIAILQDCWNYFDAVIESAPATLAKGPRGGGRDRDAVSDHTREAERHYCAGMGFRVLPRTPWDEQRDVVLTTLRSAPQNAKWPISYALRRIAWHVVDHAWEIEDKSV